LQTRIFPAILRYARALLVAEDAQLPTHDAGQSGRILIPRIQVAGWIAHMFLGALPQQTPEHPVVDFAYLLCAQWPQELAKLRCVLAYFDRIADKPPSGYLEIERLVTTTRTAAEWEADPSPLQPLTVDPTGVIEDADGCRQVDFANRYLGGGVLTGGCVQEEIRFAMAPELFCGMIVSPKMGRAEAIVLRGAERVVQTSGYARSLQYVGPYSDPCDRAADGTPDIELVAIDAIDYRHADHTSQFSQIAILRELNKARSGFLRDARQLPIASGNWGCGVFGGDPPLKAVIQWLAASAEGRALRYFSFGDARVGELAEFAAAARERKDSVGAVFKRLLAVHGEGGMALYQRLLAS
jgi:poly(ADP-ribose) glycohydrolase